MSAQYCSAAWVHKQSVGNHQYIQQCAYAAHYLEHAGQNLQPPDEVVIFFPDTGRKAAVHQGLNLHIARTQMDCLAYI